jgi:hypothetical protein
VHAKSRGAWCMSTSNAYVGCPRLFLHDLTLQAAMAAAASVPASLLSSPADKDVPEALRTGVLTLADGTLRWTCNADVAKTATIVAADVVGK